MKRSLISIFAFFFIQTLNGQSFDNGFEFNLPYDDTTSVEFFPEFPYDPITNDDFVNTDDKGNFIVNGKPYRFFGANLTTQAAFPQKSDAPLIAGRMRKFGINLIRFHHIDNPWSNGSLFYNINGTRQFNTELLDRLDYLIYQLKQNGIYVNMNLNVSRTFEKSDGVIHADSLSDYGKGITQFDPKMIELEKEYAKMLLDHVNPYTGITLAEDPVLAMVEIINENSLYRMWYSGDLKPISEGGILPVYYNNQLDSLWMDYLVEKYDSTAALEESWNKNVKTGDTIVFDDFEEGIGSAWKLETQQTAIANYSTTADAANGSLAALVNVTATSTETWHTQFKYTGLSIKKDSIYEVILKAKADAPKSINLVFQRDEAPYTYYKGQSFVLDTIYKEFKVSFKAPEDNDGKLRVSFSFFNKLGNFYFDDFLFKKESNDGLKIEETLEDRNIERLSSNDFMSYTKKRVMDLTEFYASVQINFLENMKIFLRDSIGVTAPLTGTNWFTGPEDVYVQNTLDYIDNHSYWDHPSFPNQPWSPTDWTIKNTPMLTSSSGTIENLFSGMIVKNKPYTVSEYNHAFPNHYQSELLPIITSYLSFNDADGFMIFTYSGSWDWSEDKISNYFDTHRNSSLMGSYPLFSYVFRNNLINSADSVLSIDYSYEDVLRLPLSLENWWSAHVPYSRKLSNNQRIEISFDNDRDFNLTTLPTDPQNPIDFNNGQLYWDNNGLFKINTEKFTSICGYLNENQGTKTDMLEIESGSNFGAVNWLSLTDSALNKSPKSILSIGTKMMNTAMAWDGTTTVHNNWGNSPALVYPLTLKLKLKTDFPALAIFPLNEFGEIILNKADTINTDTITGYTSITLDQSSDKTLWYGIEGTEAVIAKDTSSNINAVHKQSSPIVYPNPASGYVCFEWENTFGDAELKIYSLTGTVLYEEKIKNKENISIQKFGSGVYLYRLKFKKSTFSGRIVVN